MFTDLTQKATAVLKKEWSVADIDIAWTVPREKNFGDASTNVALQLAKRLGKKPQEIAEVLCKELAAVKGVERTEVAGAGYVNVTLTPEALLQELQDTEEAQQPAPTRKKEAPVIVEGADPNIAKPLGIHHIMPAIIGQSVVNLYRHAGYNVLHWNYIGDWGTQFGHLAAAVKRWGTGKKVAEYSVDELLALYVRFHNEAEKDPALLDEGREAFRALEAGDTELLAFWKDVVEVTKKSLSSLYERLHVSYDLELGESFYNDKMEAILQEGIAKKVFQEGERGALIVSFPPESNLPVFMVRRSDGATLYSTRDIAQMRYRIDTYHPLAINIPTDVSQSLHFQQLIATCKMLGWKLPAFDHVVFGRMSFRDKQMSTRKGNILKLEEVLDEAVTRAEKIIAEHEGIQTDDIHALAEMMGIGALVYGILSQNRKMNIVFDWDKMLSFEGNSAPYLQYTHARAKSVLRKAESGNALVYPRVLSLTESERLLIRTLLLFPSILQDARESHMPHKLATYLHTLSQDFNSFYNNDQILTAEGSSRELRITLTSFSARVLKTGAHILTLRLPERM